MTKIKKSAFAFGAACALALTGGLTALKTIPADAATVTNDYYGSKLTSGSIEKAFYDALVNMATDPDGAGPQLSPFRNGDPYPVPSTETAIHSKLEDYETGDTTLVKAFGVALDCFRYDYVDLFYVDFDALTFTVTKTELDATPTYEYGISIGAGNAKSYLLNGITANDLNDAGGIFDTYTTAYTALEGDITTAVSAVTAVKDQVAEVSKLLCKEYTLGYDDYANTTNLIAGKSKLATSEGLSRVFKVAMNKMNVDCELVSGYYVQNGVTKAWTWNYVEDNGKWYAVDLAANLATKSDKYVYLTKETFNLDHYEDQVVSLSKHKLPYPALEDGKFTVEDTGTLEIDDTTNPGTVVVSFEGKDIDSIKIRVQKDGAWEEWKTIKAYAQEVNDAAAAEDPPVPAPVVIDEKTEENQTGTNTATFTALTPGEYEFGVFDSDKRIVSLDLTTGDKALSPQTISTTATPVEIPYSEKLIVNGTLEIDVTIETSTGVKVSNDNVDYKIENVQLSTDGKSVKFDFTPGTQLKDNGLRYTFTPANLAAVKEVDGAEVADTDTEIALTSYSLVYSHKSIVADKVYGGSNLSTEIVVKPSLAFNNELSLDGWKYGKDNKSMTESMRSSLTLTATKPEADATTIETTVNGIYTETGVVKKVVPYNVSLTVDGQAVTVPDGSYVKLAFPYPAEYLNATTGLDSSVVFKVLQFKRGNDGAIDYTNPTVVDAVATKQGIVAAVNGFDAFAVVALGKTELNITAGTEEKAILTQTSGVGGKITTDGNKPVNTLKAGDSITYTLTPESTDYKVGFVTLNGKDITTTKVTSDNKIILTYAELVKDDSGTDVDALSNVLQVEFVKDDASAESIIAAAKGFAAGTITDQLDTTKGYDSTVITEIGDVSSSYPSGSIVTGGDSGIINPPNPGTFDPSSTKTQMIIVLSVVGGIALIGAIAIIYCGAVRPKIVREREEEAARIAAQRERRANRNRAGYDSRRR